MSLRISVLIHNRNRAAKLARCLKSVAQLTYRPIEVLILDAGSNDESLEVIDDATRSMVDHGIDARLVQCQMMGVAASRNLAAKEANGDLLCFLDNDATIGPQDAIESLVKAFEVDTSLAVVGFCILDGDGDEYDPFAWVYRRSIKSWRNRSFDTFTYAGGGCCIRTNAFVAVGGFWEHLVYSREEEEFGFALIQGGWRLVYDPRVVIRHYPDRRESSDISKRRRIELKNGILVLWRRLPWPIAMIAIAARIATMSIRSIIRQPNSVVQLWLGVGDAVTELKTMPNARRPIGLGATWRYFRLQI